MKTYLASRIGIVVIFMMIVANASAQFNAPEFTQRLQEVMEKDSLPGMAVVLVSTKGVTYQYSFGDADIAAGTANTLDAYRQSIDTMFRQQYEVNVKQGALNNHGLLKDRVEPNTDRKLITPFILN